MIYRNLGNTGLKVSVIALGNWLNSDKPEDLEKNEKILKRAWELGINYFDTAELYGNGEGEKQLGKAIKKLNIPRSNIVISTKIYWGFHPKSGDVLQVNQIGASRKHLLEGIERSLQNLDEKYVDIVFVHQYDLETPVEEICRACDAIVRSGKSLYWGTSEWPVGMIIDAIHICDKYKLNKPVTEQCQYNLIERSLVDYEYYYLFKAFGYGTTVYSPLCRGILTGKYNDGIPKELNLQTYAYPAIKRLFDETYKTLNLPEKLKKMQLLCDRMGAKMSQVALAWVIYNKDVSCAITGASRVEQLEESLKCLEIVNHLTKDILNEIDEIMETLPPKLRDSKKYDAITDTLPEIPTRRELQP